MSGTPTHNCWVNMMQRCYNENSTAYRKYGAHGVTVCTRWHSFAAFYADMGERPHGYTLDRIDNEKGYSPTNCRWATQRTQQNNRTNNRLITLNRETLTLQQWSDKTGIAHKTLLYRINAGWPLERALTEAPILGRNQYS